jgi:hypothetical protein
VRRAFLVFAPPPRITVQRAHHERKSVAARRAILNLKKTRADRVRFFSD